MALTGAIVRKSIDDAADDHPEGDDEHPSGWWAVRLVDDCEACADLRVVVGVEELGGNGTGLEVHLEPASARRLRTALADALREIGESPD